MCRRPGIGLAVTVLLWSCSQSSSASNASGGEEPASSGQCDDGPVAVVSPGGTPEVSVDTLAATDCALRIVDVRTRAEVEASGVIPGSEHVPLERVDAVQRWLAAAGVAVEEDSDLAAVLRAPPLGSRKDLLAAVSKPEHVGCGHLRLSLQHPEDYGVRPALLRDVLAAYFRLLWSPDPRLEFVVLEGGHAESAIVEVDMGGPVHAYSNIPLLSPRVGDTEVFVVHPQVSVFIRRKNAAFLLEAVPSLMASGVHEPAFLTTRYALAQQQLTETLTHLAPHLPVFVAEVRGDGFEVHPRKQQTHD